jgi:Secretion system C-terminal sorting domain
MFYRQYFIFKTFVAGFNYFTIKLYPNPTSNTITINYSCAKSDGIFTIYSLNGEALQQVMLDKNNNKQVIDLSTFVAGMYTYKCVFATCGTTAGKFVKTN